MGKFDALCLFLVLFAVVPRFSRGGFFKIIGCCKRIRPNGSDADGMQFNSVLDCIMSGERDYWNVTTVLLLKSCGFGVYKYLSRFAFNKDVIISSLDSSALKFPVKTPLEISFGRNITFSGIKIALSGTGNSTVSIFSSEKKSSVSFTGCIFVPGANMVFKTFVHVTVRATLFGIWGTELTKFWTNKESPPMLEIEKGSLEFIGEGNQVQCIKGSQATIKMNICHDTTITDVHMFKGGGGFPIFDFSPCVQPVEKVPTLLMQGVTFEGQVPNQYSAWVILRGDAVKGPTVNLRDNYYYNLSSEAQAGTGTVYRFIGSITMGNSNFSLSRSSNISVPSWWLNDMHLASLECSFDGKKYNTWILPIGGTEVLRYDPCHSFCCYVEDERLKRKIFETNIIYCTAWSPIVYVISTCPLGKPRRKRSQVAVQKIVKADAYTEDRVAITLEERAYYFINAKGHHPIVFKNIHFKKYGGHGVAKMLVGGDVSCGVSANVEMTGCLVDKDVVVKLRHDAHFTAAETTFNQGSAESVLSLIGDVNQVVQLSNCVLADTVCHTMLMGPMCGKVAIKDTELRKTADTPCTRAAVDFRICNVDLDLAKNEVPNLEIEGITFEGEVANLGDVTWIKVLGSHEKGPNVTLINTDYSGLAGKEATQAGRVFKLFKSLPINGSPFNKESKFTLARSSNRSASSERDTYSVSVGCFGSDGKVFRDDMLEPLEPGEISVNAYPFCPDYCCYIVVETYYRYGNTIDECVNIGYKQRMSDIVINVMRDLCKMKRSIPPTSFMTIAKADTYIGKRVAIRLQDGDYRIVNSYHHGIVFKSIHFKKETGGAQNGVAKILVGRASLMTAFRARVIMIGCYVGEGIVVNVRHNVDYIATDTIFEQGKTESVLYFSSAESLKATIVNCTFDDMENEHEMITGYSCGRVEMGNTYLVKRAVFKEAAINLSPCASNDDNKPGTVELEKLHFRGEIEDKFDAAWIKVQGNRNGPMVTLKDNNYTSLNGSDWERPRVYQFWLFVPIKDLDTIPIEFSVTREAQTEEQILTNWDGNEKLAIVLYAVTAPVPYGYSTIFPIGNGNLRERQTYKVGALFRTGAAACCYATKSSAMGQRSVEYFSGNSIEECLGKDGYRPWVRMVTVTKNCPLGNLQELRTANIERYPYSAEPFLLITLRKGQRFTINGGQHRLLKSEGLKFHWED